MVVMDERDKRPFSMASTPDEKGFIELHIGASEINLYAKAVMDRILKRSSNRGRYSPRRSVAAR